MNRSMPSIGLQSCAVKSSFTLGLYVVVKTDDSGLVGTDVADGVG